MAIILIKSGPVYTSISPSGTDIAWKTLSYHAEVWVQGKYRKEMKNIERSFCYKTRGAGGRFLTGFLPRVLNSLTAMGYGPNEIKINYSYKEVVPTKPNLDEFSLRDYQEELVKVALDEKRGVLASPTGSGKTVVAGAIIKHFPTHHVLFIIPSKSLLHQTRKRFVHHFGPDDIGIMGDGIKEPNRITIGIINTVAKYSSSETIRNMDVIIIDECHKVGKKGMYEELLIASNAPYRFGLTATPPKDDKYRELSVEGLLGPVIKRIPMKTLEGKVLAKPKVRFIELPEQSTLRQNYRSYSDIYQKGVVDNRILNRRVLQEALSLIQNEGRTCLIIVKRIEHGKNLKEMLERLYPNKIKSEFLWSETDSDKRENIRIGLDAGKYQLAITTSVWKEGVDIPSLGAIINAAGGKEEIPTLQWLGRGMRKPPGKEDLIIVDFFDPSHHFLISHFGKRMCLYFRFGWI